MKILTPLLLALVSVVYSHGAAIALAPPPTTEKDLAVVPTLPASAAEVSAPLRLQNGAISQLQQTELAEGGRAVFRFTVDQDGDYSVHASVNAPAEDANSFFVNIDSQPESPLMIWDIVELTNGFEERMVSWRGNGDAQSDEFSPKIFKLAAGEHKLIIVGREPTQLKSLSVRLFRAVAAPSPGSLASIQQRYAEAAANYDREMRALSDTSAGQAGADKLRKKLNDDQSEQFAAALRLAEDNPRSTTGFNALEWVLKIVRSYYLPAGPRALAIMNEQYVKQPEIGGMLATLTYYFPDPEDASYQGALDLLNAVVADNPDRTARGHAALGLAWLVKRKLRQAEWQGDAVALPRAAAEAEKAFESVIRDYGDCMNLRTSGIATVRPTLGSEAESELHEIRHLSLGRDAPEIEGDDIEGVPMKLSDCRGRIVVLVFWASWCGPCMAAVPHEKDLVERFKGRPFVLLGVNGDDTTHAAVKAVTKNQIPWRSFWNGKKGSGNTIASDWNVRGWPTLYVLDQHGTIRKKNIQGKVLDEALEQLVLGAEKQKTRG